MSQRRRRNRGIKWNLRTVGIDVPADGSTSVVAMQINYEVFLAFKYHTIKGLAGVGVKLYIF
jgi:hypothetical protein